MPRAIDHLVLAVRDLDAASAFYERLGFQVGARNRHPWGTENHIVQFAGSFLELLALGSAAALEPAKPAQFSFGCFLADYLAKQEGFAMLVLKSDAAKADAAAFAAAGIGAYEPFFFERRARRPDGAETTVAFTLAFATNASAEAGFFVCQQHFPENFWNPAFQRHPNGAMRVKTVALAAENPPDHQTFVAAFANGRNDAAAPGGFSLAVPDGRIDVLAPQEAEAQYGVRHSGPARLIAFTMAVPDLANIGAILSKQDVPHRTLGERIVVPPEAAFGAAIGFEAE